MQKNDRIIVDITGIISDGSGIGRQDGFAVFVKGTAVGDRAEVLIIKVNKNYAVGKLLNLLSRSPVRIENDCPAFPRCGGCCFRHINYEAELEIKRRKVQDALTRIGGIDVQVEEILADKCSKYRNKAQYPVADEAIGFYAEHSHRIISCRDCRLQPDEFELIIDIFDQYRHRHQLSSYDGKSGLIRHLYIRKAEVTGQIMVCVVINGDALPYADELSSLLVDALPSIKSVVINVNKNKNNVILSDRFINVFGDGYIDDELCKVKVRLSPSSFYQVNHTMAEKLYEKAKEFAGTGDKLIDLYCGAGTIALSMADRFKSVIGVEIVKRAVEDAKFNATLNQIKNAVFYCGDAYETAKSIEGGCDVLIVDPPRKGLSEELPKLIAKQFCPKKVVYVSCDPATLARDCKAFASLGYKVERACAADLFARTSHVETICLMTQGL